MYAWFVFCVVFLKYAAALLSCTELVCARANLNYIITELYYNCTAQCSNLAQGRVYAFSSFFTRLFLSVPISRNTEILSHFPTINYRILTHVGSKDRFNLRTNFIVLDVCKIAELHQPHSLPVPCLIPCFGVRRG